MIFPTNELKHSDTPYHSFNVSMKLPSLNVSGDGERVLVGKYSPSIKKPHHNPLESLLEVF